MSMTGDGNHNQPPPTTMQTMPSSPPPTALGGPGASTATATAGKVAVSPRLRRRAAVPDAGSPQGMPLRRRWGRFAIGAFLALLGGWVSASLYISAGSRVEVVAMADDVGAYEPITRDDLRVVRVAADPGVDTIDAGDIDQVVDRIAAIKLVEGSLLTPNQLFREDAEILQENERLVGALLEPGAAPSDLCAGIEVNVAIGAAGGEDAEPTQVDGWLYDVDSPDEDSGERRVSIAVDQSQATAVQDAARQGNLSVSAEETC